MVVTFVACLLDRLIRCYINLASVAQRVDNTIQWINLYLLDNSIGFDSTYPMHSDLSPVYQYPTFQQLRPGSLANGKFIFVDKQDPPQYTIFFLSTPLKHAWRIAESKKKVLKYIFLVNSRLLSMLCSDWLSY